jgi:glutathione S-transferase
MLKLHVFPLSPRAFKVTAVAEHLGLDYEKVFVDLTKGVQKTPEFSALNPNQRMPVMEDGDFVLWESGAIMQYLALKRPEAGLLSLDPRRLADVTRWQCWDLAHWEASCAILIFENALKAFFKIGEADPAEIAKGEERFHRAAGVLNGHLKGKRYVADGRLTIADFALGASLNMAGMAKIPVDGYAEIKRWYADLSSLPAWRKSLAVPQAA